MPTRRDAILLLASSATWLGGCGMVTSREPLYDPAKDRVFDSALAGRWDSPDMQLDIVSVDERAYTLAIVTRDPGRSPEGEVAQPFPADLVRLDGATYFFLTDAPWPTWTEDDRASWKSLASMPFWRVERFGDVLRLSALDRERLVELLAAEPDSVKHEVWRGSDQPPTRARPSDVAETRSLWTGGIALTDSSDRVRWFLKEHREELWNDAMLLQRVRQ